MDSPIKRHGGKHYLSGWINEHIREARMKFKITHFVEPFFGAGSVTLDLDISNLSVVANDIDGDLTNFWCVLQSPSAFEELKRRLEATPFSEIEFEAAATSDYEVDRAAAFFVRCRQSRQALGKDFATLSKTRTRRGMNEQVSAWLTAIEGLPQVHDFLKRIVITCKDFEDLIRSEDSPNTLFYLDPTYLHETRTAKDCYAHEMSREDHERLLLCLAGIKGKFLLSGYPSDLYEWAAKTAGWSVRTKQIDNKASSSKVKEIKTECLWANF